MNTSPNAVSDLIRRTTTRRLATDPADLQLFQPRDLDGAHRRTPRGAVDWRVPPPEPVAYPQAPPPKLGRWRWKLVLLSLLAVAGGVAVWQRWSSNDQVAAQLTLPRPPPPPVVATPAPVPEAAVKPDVVAIPSPPAEVVTDPVVSEPPKVVTDPVVPEPPKVSKVTKVKKRAHVTRHVVKPAAKHAPAAASTPVAAPAPTKPVGRTRPAAQANDTENPL